MYAFTKLAKCQAVCTERRIAHVGCAVAALPCAKTRYIRLGSDGAFERASWFDHSEDRCRRGCAVFMPVYAKTTHGVRRRKNICATGRRHRHL